jgi:molybdopterin-guanine dinucleotide biosynthesis protein A
MTALIEDAACVILAGGESRRMGRNKAQAELVGRTLVERVALTVSPLFEERMLSLNPEGYQISVDGFTVLADTLPGRGPALGVCSALERSKEDWVFVVGCDHPFLSATVVKYLSELRDGHDAVVPVVKGKTQTICAFYKKSCLAPLKQRVERGERGLMRFLKESDGLKVRYVDEASLLQADRELVSFIDVDTEEDLKKAEVKAAKERANEDCT